MRVFSSNTETNSFGRATLIAEAQMRTPKTELRTLLLGIQNKDVVLIGNRTRT